MIAHVSNGTNGGNSPAVYVDNAVVLNCATTTGHPSQAEVALPIKKGQTITTRSNGVVSNYNIAFYSFY